MSVQYINPFTDFGFKKLFGEEASKPLLKDFLNALLPAESRIRDFEFKDREQLGLTRFERKAIYDLHCESESGERFIVEMQKAKQDFFKDRTVFYSTFPIREQAEQGGEWNFELAAVYCIGILDFTFDTGIDDPAKGEVIHTVRLKDQHNTVFYDKLTFIYLEMPNFRKEEGELTTRLDMWLYFLKRLERLEEIPRIFRGEPIFHAALERTRLAALTPTERKAYDENLKVYWDLINVVKSAHGEGKAEGREEGLAEGRAEGLAEGRAEGLVEGRAAGLAEGREEGFEQGRSDGIAEGLAEALNRMIASGLSEDDARRILGLNRADV
jgi:predicted transposase/invertase (TIGR01784 family)